MGFIVNSAGFYAHRLPFLFLHLDENVVVVPLEKVVLPRINARSQLVLVKVGASLVHGRFEAVPQAMQNFLVIGLISVPQSERSVQTTPDLHWNHAT